MQIYSSECYNVRSLELLDWIIFTKRFNLLLVDDGGVLNITFVSVPLCYEVLIIILSLLFLF